MDEYDSAGRTIECRAGLKVLIPYLPPKRPDDYKRDIPPGYPPMVIYDGVRCNYWIVLREGEMPYMHGTHRFNDNDMEWLRSIEGQVEEMLHNNTRTDGSID